MDTPRWRRPRGIGVAFPLVVVVAALAGCSTPDTGPYVLCTARDGGGGEWVARDINSLSAQERALDDCGEQSAIPTTCVAASCDRQW